LIGHSKHYPPQIPFPFKNINLIAFGNIIVTVFLKKLILLHVLNCFDELILKNKKYYFNIFQHKKQPQSQPKHTASPHERKIKS